MPRFLNTSLAYGEIQKIVTNAKFELVLISPYIKIPAEFVDRLKDTQKNTKITIVCREEDLTKEEKDNLKLLPNLELRFDKNLHAKCFYNDSSMVITSLNLYDYSVQNNHEMGILLTIKDDAEVFNEARNEANHIINLAELFRLKRLQTNDSNIPSKLQHHNNIEKKAQESVSSSILKDIGNFFNNKIIQNGHCIRCGTIIPLDVDKPYCKDCYDNWTKWENPDYEENVCQSCGKRASTSMNKPLCRSCYKKS
jgi:hypothetical protein